MVETVSIPWVNGGAPFKVDRGSFAPDDIRKGTLAKIHAMKEALAGLDSLDEDSRKLIREDATVVAEMARVSTIMHSFLGRVDTKVQAMAPDEVRARLTLEEMQALMGALQASLPRGAGARPLVSSAPKANSPS